MEQSVYLNDLWGKIKKYWIYVILCGVAFSFLAFAYTSLFVSSLYTSSVDFVGNNGFVDESGQYDKTIQYQDYVASVKLVDTYVGILESGTAYLENAGNALEPAVSLKMMRQYVSFYRNEDTAIFGINVTTKDPALSQRICVELSKTVKPFLEEKMPGSKVSLINDKIEEGVLTYPDKKSVCVTAGAIGILFAVFALFVRSLFDNTVRSEEDFKNKFDKNFLGEICDISEKSKKNKGARLSETKKFQFSESFKTVRTGLFYALSARDKNIVVVSSASANEGKTTVSCNLAKAMTQSGAKVLLIDADMRRPSVNRYFKAASKYGLAEVLSKQKTFEEALLKDTPYGVDLLLSGVLPPNPSELLGSETMKTLLAEISPLYDYILIDTAPINMVSDALTFIDETAGVLVVAKSKSTTYTDLEKIFGKVESFNGNIIGVVINGAERSKKEYRKNNKYYARS